MILNGGQSDRNICLIGVLGFNEGLGIGVDLEEMDGFVTPEGEILRRIGEVVYVRFVLDQCESRWQLKVVVMVDYGGIDFDFAAAWIGYAASERCCRRRCSSDRFRRWRGCAG